MQLLENYFVNGYEITVQTELQSVADVLCIWLNTVMKITITSFCKTIRVSKSILENV